MNKTLEIIKKAYKPYRYTYINNATIIDTTSGKYVIKEKNDKKIKDVFDYLKFKNFNNYAPLIEDNRDDFEVYKYIEDTKISKEEKANDLIDVAGMLHNKTSYYKDVTSDQYQEIYDNILNNINFLNDYYDKLYDSIFNEIFMSPSHYLLFRNYTYIKNTLSFSKESLDKWWDNVKEENKERVSLIHNNLKTEHLIENDRPYLISWNHAKFDTPILDLIKFYQAEFFDLNFEELLNKYINKYSLSENEKLLFFTVISLPPKIEFAKTEIKSCQNVRVGLDYVFKTEHLIRPYYSKKQEK